MASLERVALLFPGQGSYRPGFLTHLVSQSVEAARVVGEIDGTAARLQVETLSERMVAGTAPTLEVLLRDEPDLLQLAIYGASVAVQATVRDRVPATVAVMGHSLGEVAALVAGGALTAAEGAEVVIRRSAALRTLPAPGGLLALSCDADRAQQILDLVGDPWASVAAENAPSQTVLSGPHPSLATIAAVARELRVASVALASPYAFHSPVMAPVVAGFARQLAALPQRPLTVPVYSPTLGRFVRPDDAVGDVLAQALVRRVRFSAGVLRLSRQGATTFWECSASDGLTRLVQRLLPHATVRSGGGRDDDGAQDELQTGAVQVPAAANQVDATPAAQKHPAATPAISVPAARAASATSDVPEPAGEAAGEPPAQRLPGSRDEVFAGLRSLYAAALEYPEEVFAEDVSLEADLGVDSVKQTELLGRAAERYGMPDRPDDFRLGDYDTMGRLVDYVWSARARSLEGDGLKASAR